MSGTPLSQTGFAEFVGTLLSEVFDATISSQLDQQRQLDELAAATLLNEAEVAELVITEVQVNGELANFFPSGQPGEPTSVFVGAPYHPEGPTAGEAPPFTRFLGLSLKPGEDFVITDSGDFLTAAGVDRIRNAVSLRLARSYLAAVRSLVTKGTPRLLIDSGRVAAKLTFQLTEKEGPAPTPLVAAAAQPANFRRSFEPPAAAASAPAASVQGFRIAVRQASDRAPQLSQLQVDVYSEVEVRFKVLFS